MTDKILSISNKTMIPIGAIALVWFVSSWIMEIKASTEINAVTIAQQGSTLLKIDEKLDKNYEKIVALEKLMEHVKTRLEDGNKRN